MTKIRPHSKMRIRHQDVQCNRDGHPTCSYFAWKEGHIRFCMDCGHDVSDYRFYKIIGKDPTGIPKGPND